MKFICFEDFRPKYGITAHKVTIWRWEKAGLFPKRTHIGEQTPAWAEPVMDCYSEALAAGHNKQTATAIAEQARPKVRFEPEHGKAA